DEVGLVLVGLLPAQRLPVAAIVGNRGVDELEAPGGKVGEFGGSGRGRDIERVRTGPDGHHIKARLCFDRGPERRQRRGEGGLVGGYLRRREIGTQRGGERLVVLDHGDDRGALHHTG